MIKFIPGHSSILQSSMIFGSPEQFFPPFAASVLTSLVLVLFPPPHSFEQVPILQEFHSQSTVDRIKDCLPLDSRNWYLWNFIHLNNAFLLYKKIMYLVYSQESYFCLQQISILYCPNRSNHYWCNLLGMVPRNP